MRTSRPRRSTGRGIFLIQVPWQIETADGATVAMTTDSACAQRLTDLEALIAWLVGVDGAYHLEALMTLIGGMFSATMALGERPLFAIDEKNQRS